MKRSNTKKTFTKKTFTKKTKENFITYGIVLAAFLVVQLMQATGSLSNLLRGLLVPLCVYVILAVSLNLVVGILGELSLGHAGFMCAGAFFGAFFSRLTDGVLPDGLRFVISLVIGAVVAAIFGILIGIPVLRLKGDYLAIVTLAFGEIIKNLMNVIYVGRDSQGLHFSTVDTSSLNMEADGQVIIKGALGITGTPKNSTFTIGIVLILIALFHLYIN